MAFEGPLPAYRAMVARGELAADPAQALAAERLQALWAKLRGYDPPPRSASGNGLLSRLLSRHHGEPGPNGMYLVGAVGRGKSMLMDLFFDAADVPRKQRTHFHAFMQNAHARFHAFRRSNGGSDDPIPPLADAVAADAALLCLDEFQINDIADAIILGRLFAALFERGVVVVTTSNTRPDDLFRGQPGRDAFLPFIELIKQRLDVLEMNAARDFRRDRLRDLDTWHVPADATARAALDRAFAEMTGGAAPRPETLMVTGRRVIVPAAAEGVARFNFFALCETALGPADYLALATHYHALIIDAIPPLSPENSDAARRFITLIDTLYDHRVKLLASAAASPDRLYERGEDAAMFERTASRLIEMRGRAWQALPHLT